MNAEEPEAKPKVKYYENATQTDHSPSAASTLQSKLDRLPFSERKVALNLAQFAQRQADGALSSDKIKNLIKTLTAEAPESVEKLVTDAEKVTNGKKYASSSITEPLSNEEKKDLEALIELAQRRLHGTI